jgi:hypothetical protein
VDDFWAKLREFDDYPSDVTPVPEILSGVLRSQHPLVCTANTQRRVTTLPVHQE